MDSSTKKLLLQLADEADSFIFFAPNDWWRNSTKKEISGEGLRRFAEMLRKRVEDTGTDK